MITRFRCGEIVHWRLAEKQISKHADISISTTCCEHSTYISHAMIQNTQVQSKIVWRLERGQEPPGYHSGR